MEGLTMSKKKSQFEKDIDNMYRSIELAVNTIVKRVSYRYEIEVYERIRDLCERHIDVVKMIDRIQTDSTCENIKQGGLNES